MNNNLKRCPFCGGQASVQEMFHSMLSNEYFVKCKKCGAETKRYYKGSRGAVKAWNRRCREELWVR